MLHWDEMSVPERIDGIKSIWKEGMSARDIAEQFRGATRNSIVGFHNRHRAKLDGYPLRTRLPAMPVEKRCKVARKRPVMRVVKAPIPKPVCVGGVPLVDLERGQCKWAINDAEPGELHMFCGSEASGNYCPYHMRLAYQPAHPVNTFRTAA